MKKLSLLLIVVVRMSILHAQSGTNVAATLCLPNGNFANYTLAPLGAYPTPNIYNTVGCYYFSHNTVADWYVSQGTPELTGPNIPQSPNSPTPTYNPNPAANSMYMWAGVLGVIGVQSEGIVTDYAFNKNTGYAVTINAIFSGGNASANATNTYFNVFMANGVPEDPGASNCGDVIPSVTSKQNVVQFPANGTNQLSVSQTYPVSTNTTAYSQLWIYPYSSLNSQCSLNLYYVNVCLDCGSTVYYNAGTVPVGNSQFGNIYAGSSSGSGGSGTVTISPAATTTFIAGTAVYLQPNFTASPTGAGQFVAEITPCQNSGSTNSSSAIATQTVINNMTGSGAYSLAGKMSNNNLSAFNNTGKHPLVDSSVYTRQIIDNFEKVNIYPNPAKNVINIDFMSSETGQVNIKITNAVGQVVAQTDKYIDNKNILQHQVINLSQLASGIYFIQVTNKSGTHVDKFIKN